MTFTVTVTFRTSQAEPASSLRIVWVKALATAVFSGIEATGAAAREARDEPIDAVMRDDAMKFAEIISSIRRHLVGSHAHTVFCTRSTAVAMIG